MDSQRFVVFDVETPNGRNDRMSAIGVNVVEDGQLTWEFESLIDPETYFASFNIQLTGISPADVDGMPTFPELWPVLEPVFSSGILVAHNAPFDMGVLAKCLTHYGISWRRAARYVCTCQMSRRCYPEFPNHKLNTVCDCLGIELDHHRAGSDSRAAALILIDELARGMDYKSFTRWYSMTPRAREG